MKKLTYQNQSEVFEKIVCDRVGRVFRVRFVVVERGGALRGRVVSCIPISEIPSLVEPARRSAGGEGCPDYCRDGVVCLLECTKPHIAQSMVKKIGGIIASPYFNKFYFLAAIKIRAPSPLIEN